MHVVTRCRLASSVGATPSVRGWTPAGGWPRADLTQRVEPGVAIGEDEQLIAKRFQRVEGADLREPRGALLGGHRAEAAADLAQQ
jgi:hypothetical protein